MIDYFIGATVPNRFDVFFFTSLHSNIDDTRKNSIRLILPNIYNIYIGSKFKFSHIRFFCFVILGENCSIFSLHLIFG